jgi:probable rRNA maturation factor
MSLRYSSSKQINNSEPIVMAITVQVEKKFQKVSLDEKRLRRFVKTVCKRFGVANAAIDIEVVGDSEIRKLNKKFLKRSSVTDCLSFNLSDDSGYPSTVYQLVINAQMAERQAKKRRHLVEAELALYIIHSLLHCFGFDDKGRKRVQRMHETEDEILQQLGYGLVYNKRAGK